MDESSSTIPKSVGGMNCCVAWSKIPLMSSVESAAPTEFLEAQKRLGYKRTSKTPVPVQEQGLVQSSVSFPKNAKYECYSTVLCMVWQGVLLYFGHWINGLRFSPCSETWCVKSGSERYSLNRGCPIDACASISSLGAFHLLNWDKWLHLVLRELPSCKALSGMRSYSEVMPWLWCNTTTSLPAPGTQDKASLCVCWDTAWPHATHLRGSSTWVLGTWRSWVGLTLLCRSLTLFPPLWEVHRLK